MNIQITGKTIRTAIKELPSALSTHALLLVVGVLIWLFLFALCRLIQQCLKEYAGSPAVKKGRLFVVSFLEGISYTLLRLPKLLFALFCLTLLYDTGKTLQDFFESQKRIEELTAVVKNLSRMDDVARITVLDDNLRTERGTLAKRYRIELLSLSGETISSQIVAMEGSELYVDSVNINFEYSAIGAGKTRNLAFPYRVYTEKLPANYAVPLTAVYNDKQIPVLFLLANDDIYGISEKDYDKRLYELMSILNDQTEGGQKKRQELGIRSFNGNAVHARLSKGQTCLVRVEGTGGISLHVQAF